MGRRIREKMLYGFVARWFEGQGYLCFEEKFLGWLRADVVCVKLDMEVAEVRLRHGKGRLPLGTFRRIVRLLEERGPMTVWQIADAMRYSRDYVARIVSVASPLYLAKHGGVVHIVGPYRPPISEAVAVEVKVGDWRTGLVQAHQYLDTCHRSYLAIYAGNYHRIPGHALEWAEKEGIGILTVTPKGRVVEKLPAQTRGPRSKGSLHSLAEDLWPRIAETLEPPKPPAQSRNPDALDDPVGNRRCGPSANKCFRKTYFVFRR